jgi:hypothetical protein
MIANMATVSTRYCADQQAGLVVVAGLLQQCLSLVGRFIQTTGVA